TLASCLLPGADVEHDAGRAFETRRMLQGGGDERGNAALHVRGAASPQTTVLHNAAMGRHGPGLRAERYSVGVTGKRDGRLAPAATDACDKIWAAFVKRHPLALETGSGQQAHQIFGARRLLAGRVDGIEADQLGCEIDGTKRHLSLRIAEFANDGSDRVL